MIKDNMVVTDPLMTTEEAAEFLCCTVSMVRSMTLSKRLEYVKIGKLVRFKRSTLNRYITEHTRPATGYKLLNQIDYQKP